MRHTIARATLATLSLCGAGAAAAQSNVILYGVADMGIEYVNNLGNVPTAANGFNPGPAHSVTRLTSGSRAGSRWGLRGTEDLGGGLGAVFALESGFNLDSGTPQQGGRLFGRQAFVGVTKAGVGQLTFGRQYTSMFEALGNFSPTRYGGYEPAVLQSGAAFREDNVAKYTGKFGAVTALGHYSFGNGTVLPQVGNTGLALGGNGEMPGSARRDSAYGVAVAYNGSTYGLVAAYDQVNPTIGTSSGTFRKFAVGASYTAGAASVMGGYRWGQSKGPAGADIQRDDYYWLGANYQFTPAFSVTLEYTYDNLRSVFGNQNLPNPWQVLLLASYNLSKRTELYLSTAYSRNAGLMLDSGLTTYANTLALGNSLVLGNGKNSMFGATVGIRHLF
ncbi:porin [Cupriavidus agavae]|uniref:Putative porin n=1 Tax=Cupriavidus agavae TaxID=1001822 RepID=A0A4Q7RT77_9BURK|nr:porin [Cupriavidus agavae]RZT36851.1 putative porin [Cupriavidus agavae]